MILPEDIEDKIVKGKRKRGKTKRGIWKKREVDYAADEILIKVRRGKDRDKVFLKKLFSGDLEKAKMKREFDNNGIGLIKVAENVDVLKKCLEIQEDPDVEYAEPNMKVTGAIIPNDTHYGNQYALPLIEAPKAWDIETGANDVMIAVLDSGIAMSGSPPSLSHPDLNDTSRFIVGYDYVDDDAYPRDEFGHGTHVAGIASAHTDNSTGIAGLSWTTKIYIIRVLDDNNEGNFGDVYSGIKEAVDYAVSNNLRLVINLSLGGSAPSYSMEQGVIYARDRNCLIVAAAGNYPPGTDEVRYPAAYSSSYDNVIAVSNTDSSDHISNRSCFGPEINVAAPGTDVYSTMPNYHVAMNDPVWGSHSQNYDYVSGTSMSSPHVAALAALVLSCDNTLSPADVRDLIEARADDLGTPSWDQYYGYGRIDAYETLKDYATSICSLTQTMTPRECIYCTVQNMTGCNFKIVTQVQCFDKCEFQLQYYIPRDKCEYVIQTRVPSCRYSDQIIPCRSWDIGPQCLQHGNFPWERYNEPFDRPINLDQQQAMRAASEMKHVKPLTRKTSRIRPTAKKRPLSHKKRYYPQ
ncbi:MAG: hypothetical protein CW691_08415 [Candidatus Bathyarchaeum sp.]|nr:MAG: hypothetical protein CW691_08415 [Candidatus Bathyarchaeum sp.]